MDIAVFCSSSNHIADHYKQTAYELGQWIAQNGHTLVYGGATGGLMDAVAEGASFEGGNIIGVIPQAVIKMNRMSSLPTTLITVESMNDRKAEMKQRATLFIALPGSYGTLDEMFDIIASGIVGEHNKPLLLFNQYGFYDHLLKQIDEMRNQHFIPGQEHYKPLVCSTLGECKEMIGTLYINK